MELTRRGFIGGLIATPAIVRADSIWVPPRRLIRPNEGVEWTVFEVSFECTQISLQNAHVTLTRFIDIISEGHPNPPQEIMFKELTTSVQKALELRPGDVVTVSK